MTVVHGLLLLSMISRKRVPRCREGKTGFHFPDHALSCPIPPPQPASTRPGKEVSARDGSPASSLQSIRPEQFAKKRHDFGLARLSLTDTRMNAEAIAEMAGGGESGPGTEFERMTIEGFLRRRLPDG